MESTTTASRCLILVVLNMVQICRVVVLYYTRACNGKNKCQYENCQRVVLYIKCIILELTQERSAAILSRWPSRCQRGYATLTPTILLQAQRGLHSCKIL